MMWPRRDESAQLADERFNESYRTSSIIPVSMSPPVSLDVRPQP
jgi:hypothetical protein